ncbi:NAD(P)H-binding protein [Thalassotalea atypica]|uniref:NAD(P)H-binding protein n=1 Tax=Thalassotalea atypica TaxID=2054316 RepID=UPI002573B60E|nr:NAD(P)H-binding protein [Thalassotalea atypica]
MTKKVAIIGYGWLGQPLASLLVNFDYSVIATCRTPEKIAQIEGSESLALNLSIQQVNLSSESSGIEQLALDDFDCVVIAITPGFKRGATDYADNVASIVAHAQRHHVRQVILLSSTGVYTGLTGELSEQSELNLSVDKVRQLNAAEQSVLSFNGHAQVLRLAGLVGPKRFPGSFLAGKTQLKDADAKVHLLHQSDAVNIIAKFIEQPHLSGIFNCVSPSDSTRELFYQKAAAVQELVPPQFDREIAQSPCKIINGEKLQQTLSYSFVVDDLLAWLSADNNQ